MLRLSPIDVAVFVAVAAPYAFQLARGHWEFIDIWDDDGNFINNSMVQDLTFANVLAMLVEVRINVYEPLSWLLKVGAPILVPRMACMAV